MTTPSMLCRCGHERQDHSLHITLHGYPCSLNGCLCAAFTKTTNPNNTAQTGGSK